MMIIPGNIILALLCIAGKTSCFFCISYQLCKFIKASLVQFDHFFHSPALIDLINEMITETICICRRNSSCYSFSCCQCSCHNSLIPLMIKMFSGKDPTLFQKCCGSFINLFHISFTYTIQYISFFHICMMVGCRIQFVQFNANYLTLLPNFFFLDEIIFFHKVVRLNILSLQKLIQKTYEIQHPVQCHFVRMAFFLH